MPSIFASDTSSYGSKIYPDSADSRSIINLRETSFFTPIIWFPPLNPANIFEVDTIFEVVKGSFFTLAEFYISFGDQIASCDYDEWGTCSIIAGKRDDFPIPSFMPSLPYRKLLHLTRSVTLVSITAVTLRTLSLVVVKVGKEEAPQVFQAFLTPLQGWVLKSLATSIVFSATLGALLTAVKITLRLPQRESLKKAQEDSPSLPDTRHQADPNNIKAGVYTVTLGNENDED